MNHITVMKQALDALEDCRDVMYQVAHGNMACSDAEGVGSALPDVMKALRAAIAHGESEPVAWMADSGTCVKPDERMNETYYHIPLYAAPQVADYVPLSDGEIYTAYIEATNQTLRPQDERLALAFARAIERAVRGGK